MKNKLRLAAAGLCLLLAAGLAGQSKAAAPSSRGVTISPAFQQVSINQNEAEHAVIFRITNNETSVQTYDLAAADFNTLGESGGLFFVGTNPTQLQKKYGLAKWFSLPQKSITIQPKQTFTLRAKIENLPDLSPGGHYGALMLSQDNQPGGGQSKVSVHPIASSLLFVTKLGGDTHKLSLSNVYVKHTLLSLPGSVTLRFHNDGNTHLIPRGVVTLSDASGRTISKGIINQDSDIILPQSYRRLYVPLQTIRPARSISRYRLTVDFRFDGYSQFRRYQTSFWVLPPGPLVILLAALAVIVILIVLGRKHWLVRAKTK